MDTHLRLTQMSKSRLSIRLFSAAVLSIFIAVTATGIAINHLFERFYQDQISIDLENELNTITSNVSFDDVGQIKVSDLNNEAYSKSLSGRYWQISLVYGEHLYSDSLWDQILPEIEQIRDGSLSLVRIPFSETEILILSWWVQIKSGEGLKLVHISVARDLAQVKAAATNLKQTPIIWLVFLTISLAAASWLQIYFGLKPLERIRTEVKGLKEGSISQLSDDFPLEIQPLADEVNSTLKSKDKMIEKARFSAGNLAHGLKTPLTIIDGLLGLSDRPKYDGLNKGIREQIRSMNETIERELARVRTNEKSLKWTDVKTVTDKLVNTMKKLPQGGEIDWQVNINANFKIPLDEHDFAELAGNILDNARKFTKSVVLVKGKWLTDQTGMLSIEDNGKGIPTSQMMDALNRGERLHNSSPGHGIGLSIVRELAASSNCQLHLSDSDLGGLKVTLKFLWRLQHQR